MRNSKILPDNNSLVFGEVSMDDIAAIHERMYVLSHIEEIKERYVKYIYKELSLQCSDIVVKTGWTHRTIQEYEGERTAMQLIKNNIFSTGEFLVLCNPSTQEPSVVVNAADFSPNVSMNKQENMLREYIREGEVNSNNLFDNFEKKATKKAVRLAAGYGLEKGSEYLAQRSARLATLAQHTASGHATTMRVNRSVSGKVAQKNAFAALYRRSAYYTASAARNKVGAAVLWQMAKKTAGSFRPITLFDALRPMDLADGTKTAPARARMLVIATRELDIYCRKNSNYQFLMKQQYFEQGK